MGFLRRAPFAVRVLVAAVVVVLGYLGVTFAQVWSASRQDRARQAQAIIVLGTAQYNGVPSPVYASRLDHALDLYRRGLAPLVVTTGGRQPGDRFTEAEAGAMYLEQHGVPGDAIERETTSTNTYDELAAAARFLKARGVTDVLLVSDPFHAYRIEAIADSLGLRADVSPTPTSRYRGVDKLVALLRETAAVAGGRIVGYSRLDRIRS